MAAYLADGIEALSYRWDKTYAITVPAPKTYVVSPDITMKDKRPIILMASIIYKMGKWEQAYVRDGDFATDSRTTRPPANAIIMELTELGNMLPAVRLAVGSTVPMRGFNQIFNPESYDWLNVFGYLEKG